MQTADCRTQSADRIQNVDLVRNVDYRLQSGYKMQTENLKCFFRLACDNISSYNLTSVTQKLFHIHLSRLFALLGNIPGRFLDQSRS